MSLPNQVTVPEVVEPSALESIQRAEVDVQIATAKKYPRQLSMVKKNMLSFATLDQETAESCFYSLPRGNKTIQGPSVRLAEIAVACYTNLRVGSRVISTITTGTEPHVVVQGVAMDLENNIAVTIEKRRRIVKKKSRESIDEDDINLATNAGSAIAFRDAVFKVVPLALVNPVFDAAKKVAIGDQKSLGERRGIMLNRFSKMGINEARVLAALEKKSVEDITLGDLETLFGLFTAIKDGQTSIDEAFPTPEKETGIKPPTMPGPAPAPAAQAPAPETPKKDYPLKRTAAPAPAPEPQAEALPISALQNDDGDLGPQETQTQQVYEGKEPTIVPGTGTLPPNQVPQAAQEPPAPAPAPAPAAAATPFKPDPKLSDELNNVLYLLHKNGKNEAQLVAVLKKNKAMKSDQNHLSELSGAKLINISRAFPNLLEDMV